MTKIEFYILANPATRSGFVRVCELIDSFDLIQDQTTYLAVNSQHEACQWDELLWTFRDNSFIPHQIISEKCQTTGLQIGWDKIEWLNFKALINLSDNIADNPKHFSHIKEIVFSDQALQAKGREKYRQYRNAECEILIHKI